jgi:hypothetical protein
VLTALCALALCAAPPPAPFTRHRAASMNPESFLWAETKRDGSIVVQKGRRPWRLLWPGGRVLRMAMSFDGKYLAAGLGGRVYLWDVPDGTFKYVIPFKKPDMLMFDEKEGTLIVATRHSPRVRTPAMDAFRNGLDGGDLLASAEKILAEAKKILDQADEEYQEWSMKTGERVDGRRRK